jgi:hypothetical protein
MRYVESEVVLRLGLKIRLGGKEAGNALEQRASKQAGFKDNVLVYCCLRVQCVLNCLSDLPYSPKRRKAMSTIASPIAHCLFLLHFADFR